MNDTAFGVPLELATKFYGIANLQPCDPRGNTNIVGDQDSLPRGQLYDEALMTVAFVIVRQDSHHYACAVNLGVTFFGSNLSDRIACVRRDIARVSKTRNDNDRNCCE